MWPIHLDNAPRDDGWVLLEDTDLTAGVLQDLSGVASGTVITIDGQSFTFIKSGTITSVTIGGGTGFKASFNGLSSYVALRRTYANVWSGYDIEDDVMALVRRVPGRTTHTLHVDRFGQFGGRELGCEAKHTEGARTATNFGGWVFGAANGVDPTIIGFRRRGRDWTHLSSAAVSGWPAFSALTKVGHSGLLQDADDADIVVSTDTTDLFMTQGVIATARTNAEVTARSVWRRV